MIVFPPCKINLGLIVHGKRSDGFHDLETVFYPLALTDVLEIIPDAGETKSLQDLPNQSVQLSASGLPVPGDPADNLTIRAYYLLKHDFPHISPVKMHLHKVIPMGAGLGGGSSDGAFALQLLNRIFSLSLSTQQLISYALQLGSDCPFFIISKAAYASSRGEMLEEVNLDLSAYSFLLVNPEVHINTGWAFSQVSPKPADSRMSVKEIITHPPESWKELLQNDFELPVFNKYPNIKKLKESLYRHGALYAAMSGSGSTVFGIFKKNDILLQEASSSIQNEHHNYHLFTIP